MSPTTAKQARGPQVWLGLTLALSVLRALAGVRMNPASADAATTVGYVIGRGLGDFAVAFVGSFLVLNWVKRELVNPGTAVGFLIVVILQWLGTGSLF